MRQQVVTQSAVGASNWLFMDTRRLVEKNTSLAATLNDSANLTYSAEVTYDRNTNVRWQAASFSAATNTVTVVLVDHGLAAGDNVQVLNTGNSSLDGQHDVASVTDDDTFTYTVTGIGTVAATSGQLISFRVFDHSSIVGETTNQDGSILRPVSAVRLNVTAHVAGSVTLTVLQQG